MTDIFTRRYNWTRHSSRPEAKECLFLAGQIDDLRSKADEVHNDLTEISLNNTSARCNPTWFDNVPGCAERHVAYLETCKDYLTNPCNTTEKTLCLAALSLYNLEDATISRPTGEK